MSHPLPTLNRKSPRPLFGLSLSYPCTGIIERIGAAWDWFWIDGQHGELSYNDAVALVKAAESIGKPGIVRIPPHDTSWAAKLLDAGAAGIIAPMVESVEEAKALVQATKFPPLGNRSFGGLRIATRTGTDYYKTANQDTVLIVQLESDHAVSISDQLAAIDGVDGLFLGPDDLVIRRNVPPQAPKDMKLIGQACQTIADACKKHGKLNVGLAGNDVGLELCKHFRHDLVVGSGDFFLLQSASAARIKAVREAFGLPAS